jgi:SAM-dependent methyltransferase
VSDRDGVPGRPTGPGPSPLRFLGTTWAHHDRGHRARRAVGFLAAALPACLLLHFTRQGLVLAGTGMATALLHGRGADVIALEPGDGMSAQFRRAHPGLPLVRGDGNALPLADSSADLVTYAQAWHWTDPARALPEAARVLRPGGALALWWNFAAVDVPWLTAQAIRIERHYDEPQPVIAPRPTETPPSSPFSAFTRRVVRWSRRVPVDVHLANLGSHSLFLTGGKARAEAFLAAERDHLLRQFADGVVEEVYDTELQVARTEPAAS